jgi:hypothetical protein
MASAKKKVDPISDRSRALNDQIAALVRTNQPRLRHLNPRMSRFLKR